MAKKTKDPQFTHCKVTFTTHPTAPWRVSFPVEENGITRRKRRMFSTEQKAMDFAADHEKNVADFGVRFGSITAEARRAYDFYRDARSELQGEEIEIPSFEALVMDAVSRLRQEHADRQQARKTVAEAVEGFIAFKAGTVSTKHATALKKILERFSKAFGTTHTHRIDGAEVEAWISAQPGIGPVSRNKLRKILKSFFAYGCTRIAGNWCDHNPLEGMKRETVPDLEPEAYSVKDAAAIMNAALEMESPILPVLTVCMFSGLRPSEAWALDFSTIDLAEDGFRTPVKHQDGTKTKTGSRVAPLTEATRAWLGTVPKLAGHGWTGPNQDFYDELNAVMSAAKVKVIHDGFRHSFITYRTAEIRDVARVSDECGNSPNIIKKHYRKLATEAAGKAFFAIRPEVAANISNITEGRVSA